MNNISLFIIKFISKINLIMPGPDVWGPHGWKFIHYITLGYPNNPTEEQKKNYYNFFMDLANVVPCSICANHFKQHLNITPLDDNALKDKDSLMAWAIEMHNHVNLRNGKKIYSIKDAIDAIVKNDDKCLILEADRTPKQFYKKQYKNENMRNIYIDKKQTVEGFNNSSIVLSISIILNVLLILYLLFKFNN